MSDICLALCFAYLGGFVATFALAADHIFGNRASEREGFAGLRTLHVWYGSLVLAALWPVIVAAFAVSAFRMSLKKEGAE
jgi:hypothetical protein